ncbi:MAG: Lrp/AsnC family transcriptional regulator [Bacteroidota bacterium]
MTLDDLDRALLELVQTDNRRTHDQLGEAVGLSPSAVRRRLKALREAGVIQSDVSILAPEVAGIQAIVHVAFAEETVTADDAFRLEMQNASEVSQCYSVSGDIDYVLVVHAADLSSYMAWAKRVLMANPAIRRADTHLVWDRVKFSTAIPV